MKAIKRLTALVMVMMIMASVLPVSAACSTPGCVKKAAQQVMDREGTDICFVVKVGKNGKGTAYFMYRRNGKVHCDRSGQVILGKETKVKKCNHYYFNRNRDAEKKVESWKQNGIQYRWRYTSFIECAEDADYAIKVHSYIEYKKCGEWKVCKGTSKNTKGLAGCKEFMHYLWSMADDDCPVAFI